MVILQHCVDQKWYKLCMLLLCQRAWSATECSKSSPADLLTFEGQIVADDGALSIQDWHIMESTWFDIEGESIISSAKQALDGKFHLRANHTLQTPSKK